MKITIEYFYSGPDIEVNGAMVRLSEEQEMTGEVDASSLLATHGDFLLSERIDHVPTWTELVSLVEELLDRPRRLREQFIADPAKLLDSPGYERDRYFGLKWDNELIKMDYQQRISLMRLSLKYPQHIHQCRRCKRRYGHTDPHCEMALNDECLVCLAPYAPSKLLTPTDMVDCEMIL